MHGLTAVVVCGGRGARLGPLGDVVNKSLLPVYGVPAVVHVLRLAFETLGARRCILVTGHLGNQVEQIVRAYMPQADLLVAPDEGHGTAHAVNSVLPACPGDDVLYAHANIGLGPRARGAIASARDRDRDAGASVWAVCAEPLAPTHPRLLCSDGWVRRATADRGLFSVGLGVIARSVLEQRVCDQPVPHETAEHWLFRAGLGHGVVRAVDIGDGWLHVEDLDTYRSGDDVRPAVTRTRSVRRVA